MPDIDPAALSRPSVSLGTPVLSAKTLAIQTPGQQKPKTSQIIPTRIDLEPLYTPLRLAIGLEQWPTYKESIAQYFTGRLNRTELAERTRTILDTPEKDRLHNKLLAAIIANVTREMPDQGLAPWVSANDKPPAATVTKPSTGDAAERRLKGEIMQLPNRDRRRIKDLVHNEFDPHEALAIAFADSFKRPSRTVDAPHSSGVLNSMNLELEIRKRYAQPLALESGEFPDAGAIETRMLPFCYENGLVGGHASDAPRLMAIAAETFIKENLASIFSRTRSNAPGESALPGFGMAATWIQTHQYRSQLSREEDAALRGEIARDKCGFLPVEAKAAAELSPLGMSDLRIALGISDAGVARFPIIRTAVINGFREGELESWSEYTWLPGWDFPSVPPPAVPAPATSPASQGVAAAAAAAAAVAVAAVAATTNGKEAGEEVPANGVPGTMEIDLDLPWEGANVSDALGLDHLLDSCLITGT